MFKIKSATKMNTRKKAKRSRKRTTHFLINKTTTLPLTMKNRAKKKLRNHSKNYLQTPKKVKPSLRSLESKNSHK